MMKCGHTANARRRVNDDEWIDCCAICDCVEIAKESIDLTGRMATCCGKDSHRPSDPDKLAFFEYRGPGSKAATTICKNCKYALIAHQRKKQTENEGNRTFKNVCDDFVPIGPYELDRYYCGCRGWD